MSEEKGSKLVDYYLWAASRFLTSDGKPLSKKTRADKARKFNLPIIQTGNSALIDPVQGDNRLREFALQRRSQKEKAVPQRIAKEAEAALAAGDAE
jgi:hypothetical protein